MKRIHILAGVILILASSFVIEYYTNSRFPTTALPLIGVPELPIGETNEFTCIREMEQVGTYSYTVTGKSGGVYTMLSATDVSVEGKRLQLTSSFTFDEVYRPELYMLTVEQGEETNKFNVTFSGGNVTSTVQFSNESVTLSEPFPDDAFLVENNMPGFWDILLRSTELKEGQRYKAQAYIPQGGRMFDLEFYVNEGTKPLTIDGDEYACTLIQESKLSLSFYLYEGELVQMRDTGQDIIFQKIIG